MQLDNGNKTSPVTVLPKQQSSLIAPKDELFMNEIIGYGCITTMVNVRGEIVVLGVSGHFVGYGSFRRITVSCYTLYYTQ